MPDLSPSRSAFLKRQLYLLPLIVLAFLAVLSNALLSVQVSAAREDAALINLTGRQRMLSVRIAWDATQLASADAAATQERNSLRSDLRETLARFQSSQARLSDPASDLYRSRDASEVRLLYAGHLNAEVARYVAAAQRILELPAAQLGTQTPDVRTVQQQARGTLLADLDHIVSRAEQRSVVYNATLSTLAWLRTALVLGVLAVLGGFVLRPLERRNRTLLSGLKGERDLARTIVESMGQGLSITNHDARLSLVNPALTTLLGYSATDLLGRRALDFVEVETPLHSTAGDDPAHSPATRQLPGTPLELSAQLIHRDGHRVPVLLNSVSLAPADGGGRVTVITDLSARIQAERELQGREARYHALAANFPGGAVVLFDRELRYLIADGAGLADVGLTRERMEGRLLFEIFPPEVSEVIAPDHLAALDGLSSERELTFFGHTYMVQTFPVPEKAGSDFGIEFGTVIVRDITADMQARAASEAQTAELALLAQEADAARRDAQTLTDLTRTLSESQSLADLTAQTFRLLAPAVAATWVTLVQIRDDRTSVLALHGPAADEEWGQPIQQTFRGEAIRRALRDGPQYLEQVSQPDLVKQGVTGAALVPLPHKPQRGEVVLVAARSGRALSWTPSQRTLLETAARTVCAAWERVTLLEELQVAADHARALVAISRLAETARTQEEVATQAGAILAQATGMDWLGLIVSEGDTVRILTAYSGARVHEAFRALATRTFSHAQSAGLLWQALETNQAVYVDDYAAYDTAIPALVAQGMRAAAWIPLSVSGQQRLLLSAVRLHEARAWSVQERSLFESAARSIHLTLERQSYLREMETAALSDKLTGLANRRAFERDLDERLSRAGGGLPAPFGVMMIDLDGLKHFNDTHGHDRGDALLRTFGDALRASFRAGDQLYRLGGDEFALLLPGAAAVSELLNRVQRAARLTQDMGFTDAAASAGVAFCPADGSSALPLIRLADERLYEEKHDRSLLGVVRA